jgi:hypothetical protein
MMNSPYYFGPPVLGDPVYAYNIFKICQIFLGNMHTFMHMYVYARQKFNKNQAYSTNTC